MTAPQETRQKRLLFLATEYASFQHHKKDMPVAAATAGFDVTIAARGAAPRQANGLRLIDIPWKRAGSTVKALLQVLPDVMRVRRLLDGVKPDVLHTIDLKPAIIGAVAAFGRDVAVVHSINGFGFVFYETSRPARLIQKICGLVLQLSVRLNNGRIVVQNRHDADVVRRMGIAENRLRLIRGSGVDPAHVEVQPLPPRPPVRFLIMARLLYLKGIQVAVEASALLRQRGVPVALTVCGAPDPGNPSSIPEDVIAGWSTAPGITFLGHVADIRPALAENHIVLHPALGGEGLPKALLEAAAAGRAMIATDIPGNTEVVVQEETGLLVPPGDAGALADAMQRAVNTPADCDRWGQAARAKFMAEFTAGLILEQHTQLYREFTALDS